MLQNQNIFYRSTLQNQINHSAPYVRVDKNRTRGCDQKLKPSQHVNSHEETPINY